eukprot:m.219476 g.219476  ORF g.219476 m.219476 type:complete len:196 (-) comp18695_c0_seq10:4072-4659(-)
MAARAAFRPSPGYGWSLWFGMKNRALVMLTVALFHVLKKNVVTILVRLLQRRGGSDGKKRRSAWARPESVYSAQSTESVTWESTVTDKKRLKSLLGRERQRQQVIFELIQTERQYLRDLNIIKGLFRRSVMEQTQLSADQIWRLFSNVDDVIKANAGGRCIFPVPCILRQPEPGRGAVPRAQAKQRSVCRSNAGL